MDRQEIARLAHEVNRAYCVAIGDDTQPRWENAPDWQKASALTGVDMHLAGDHDAKASHEAWMEQKIADGWVWGPEKDPERKEHPCLLPYAGLDFEQQVKDHLFRGVVHACRSLLI